MSDAVVDVSVRLREGAVSWREVDGEVIVLDLQSSEYLGVNPTGTVLWLMLAEGTTTEAMRSALAEQFDVGADRAAADVEAFLTAARSHQLLAE